MGAQEAGEEVDEQSHNHDEEHQDDDHLKARGAAAHLALQKAAPPDWAHVFALQPAPASHSRVLASPAPPQSGRCLPARVEQVDRRPCASDASSGELTPAVQPFACGWSLKGVMFAQRKPGVGPVGRDFDRFVASASPGLLRAAYLLTGDRADAEDLVQNALLRVFRRWQTISGPPAGYAFAVLVNLSRDHKRWLRRRPRTVVRDEWDAPAPEDPVEELLNRSEVVQAARCLPRVQQAVIACRFLLDLSVGETATALDLPEGSVKSYTARALAKMRDRLTSEPTSAVEVGNA